LSSALFFVYFLLRTPRSTLFPYTTLFRSKSGLSLGGSIEVYYAQVLRACKGPDLACNESTALVRPDRGMVVDWTKTGNTGLSITGYQNADYIVDADLNNYATVSDLVNLPGSVEIAVQNIADTFDA